MELENKNRGAHMTALSNKNRIKVWLYFKASPDATLKEASEDLGVSLMTISNHKRAIRNGWKPEGAGDQND